MKKDSININLQTFKKFYLSYIFNYFNQFLSCNVCVNSGAAHNHCSYNWEANCNGRKNDSTPISTPG